MDTWTNEEINTRFHMLFVLQMRPTNKIPSPHLRPSGIVGLVQIKVYFVLYYCILITAFQ